MRTMRSAQTGCASSSRAVAVRRAGLRKLGVRAGPRNAAAAAPPAAAAASKGEPAGVSCVVEKAARLASSPKVWQTAAAAQILLADAAHADAGKFFDSKVFTPVGNTMDERAKGVKIIRAALSEKQESRNATAAENREILSQGRAAADMYIKNVRKAKMEEVEELVQVEKKAIEAEV